MKIEHQSYDTRPFNNFGLWRPKNGLVANDATKFPSSLNSNRSQQVKRPQPAGTRSVVSKMCMALEVSWPSGSRLLQQPFDKGFTSNPLSFSVPQRSSIQLGTRCTQRGPYIVLHFKIHFRHLGFPTGRASCFCKSCKTRKKNAISNSVAPSSPPLCIFSISICCANWHVKARPNQLPVINHTTNAKAKGQDTSLRCVSPHYRWFRKMANTRPPKTSLAAHKLGSKRARILQTQNCMRNLTRTGRLGFE